ncbi:bifunctional metallophosphatase/5'-nucleotidase [Actinocatenispora rupis]|uniref:5'-nucleotidase n=1 Tax=Actinocatenispora rupis TaxID=519421 RepID=A0A8J3NAD3_9ACTN|nr:5'-nucleotidase [Actinocatenispora rupis]
MACVAAVCALLAGGTPAAAGEADREIPVQLLDVTDLHGQLQPTGVAPVTNPDGTKSAVGGLAYLATHLAQLRTGQRNSITFSTGDNFTGWEQDSFWLRGEPIVEFLNQQHVRFATVGNHELDSRPEWLTDHMVDGACGGEYGTVGVASCFPDSTGRRYHGTDFPYSSANIVDKRTGRPIAPPYVVETVRNDAGRAARIGFINLTVPDTVGNLRTILSFNPSLAALDEVRTADHYAQVLQSQGVQAIVLNIHDGGVPKSGTPYDSCSDIDSSLEWGMGMAVAKAVTPAIDAVFTGHQHQLFNCVVDDPAGNPRPVIEAGAYGQAVAAMSLTLDADTGDVDRSRTVAHNIANTHDVTPDPTTQAMVDHWSGYFAGYQQTTVGAVAADVTAARNPAGESTMGDAVADMELWEGQRDPHAADLALVKQIFLPPDLTYAPGQVPGDSPGRVLFAEVAGSPGGQSQPVVNADLTGDQLRAVLEQQWRTDASGATVFTPLAVSRNVTCTYDTSRPVGDRVRAVRVAGRPLAPGRTYRVAASVTFFEGPVYAQDTAYPAAAAATRHYRLPDEDRFAWVDYLRHVGVLRPPDTDRVRDLA